MPEKELRKKVIGKNGLSNSLLALKIVFDLIPQILLVYLISYLITNNINEGNLKYIFLGIFISFVLKGVFYHHGQARDGAPQAADGEADRVDRVPGDRVLEARHQRDEPDERADEDDSARQQQAGDRAEPGGAHRAVVPEEVLPGGGLTESPGQGRLAQGRALSASCSMKIGRAHV